MGGTRRRKYIDENQRLSPVFHAMENSFPRHGKIYADFSTLWKIMAQVFHAMENFFPRYGKYGTALPRRRSLVISDDRQSPKRYGNGRKLRTRRCCVRATSGASTER